jgi:hypothetical protein
MTNNLYTKPWLYLALTLLALLGVCYYASRDSVSDVRYRNLPRLQKGQHVRTVVKIMGRPDTAFENYGSNHNEADSVYQYNLGPLAPDAIRVYLKDSVVYEVVYND